MKIWATGAEWDQLSDGARGWGAGEDFGLCCDWDATTGFPAEVYTNALTLPATK